MFIHSIGLKLVNSKLNYNLQIKNISISTWNLRLM
jgi:hypothetical protein